MKYLRLDAAQNCEVLYPRSFPGWKCSACGGFGRAKRYGYVSVSAEGVPGREHEGRGPMDYKAHAELMQRATPFFAVSAFVGPGTNFGAPSVRILSKHKDMLFGDSCVLVTLAGLEKLKSAGIEGYLPVPLNAMFGKSKTVPLSFLEFPAPLEEPPSFFADESCFQCGSRKRVTKEWSGIWRQTIVPNTHIMGFRKGGTAYTVISEQFMEIALELHGKNGLKAHPITIFEH